MAKKEGRLRMGPLGLAKLSGRVAKKEDLLPSHPTKKS